MLIFMEDRQLATRKFYFPFLALILSLEIQLQESLEGKGGKGTRPNLSMGEPLRV